MKATYHSHTFRCKHAIGEDREYVEEAIKGGLNVLGISDHCPWIFDDPNFVSHTRMLPSQLDDYVSSVERLREEYKKDITIYLGLECEYIPVLMERQDRLLADYPFDYRILGQHFCDPEYLGPYMGFDFTDEALFIRYVDCCIEAMESGRYRYIAHPDLFKWAGAPKVYTREMSRLCRYLKSKDVPVEINLLGVVEQRHYPGDAFLSIAQEAGCSCIIGADAHQPERLSNQSAAQACMDLAARFSLPVVDYLPGLGPKHL